MCTKESLSSIKSDDESAFNGDVNLELLSKDEFNNYDNLFTPQVLKNKVGNSEIIVKNDILSSVPKDRYTNSNTFDFNQSNKSRLKRFPYSQGKKVKSLSEGECDFEKDYKFNDCLAFYETGDIGNFCSDKIPNECDDLDATALENIKLNITNVSDTAENNNINDFINEHGPNEPYVERISHTDIDNNINCITENENCLEIITSNKVSQTCFNGTNTESTSRKDDVKHVELKHNECSLTNEFFETIENINITILEKQNNLKEAVEQLMDVVQKSDFENRINALVKKSEDNSEMIEQFKKKSEDCIRQCRKFETTSENMISECINTLAEATVCYAEWVCLHSYDLKQIDKDLEDIDLFIKDTNQ